MGVRGVGVVVVVDMYDVMVMFTSGELRDCSVLYTTSWVERAIKTVTVLLVSWATAKLAIQASLSQWY